MRKATLSRLMVQLPRDSADLLDELAAEQGTTRAALMRQWIWERMETELDRRSRVRQRLAALKRGAI
jgi:hypothetical protein